MSSDKDDPNKKLAQILNATKPKNLKTETSNPQKPPIPSKSSKPGFMKKWKGGAVQAMAPNAGTLEKPIEVSPKTLLKNVGKSEMIQQPASNAPNENVYTTTPKPSMSSKPHDIFFIRKLCRRGLSELVLV